MNELSHFLCLLELKYLGEAVIFLKKEWFPAYRGNSTILFSFGEYKSVRLTEGVRFKVSAL